MSSTGVWFTELSPKKGERFRLFLQIRAINGLVFESFDNEEKIGLESKRPFEKVSVRALCYWAFFYSYP